jgi:AraC-like DNA-binding protein
MKPRLTSERVLVDLSRLGFRDVIMVGRYNYNRAHPPLRPHCHSSVFEICVLERGSQTYFIGSDRYDLIGGDVFITKPGEVHSTGREPENKGRLYWLELHINSNNLQVLNLPMQESQLLHRWLHSLPSRHLRHGEVLVPTLEHIFKVLANNQNRMRLANLQNLLARFFLDLLALAEQKTMSQFVVGTKRVLSYIEDRLREPLTVALLARQASMSESHFKKTFTLQVGISPIEYVMTRRIELGKQMLRATNTSVTRIAMDLGFVSSQHFATVFKRLTGLTPREHRRRSAFATLNENPEVGEGAGFHPVYFQ